MTEDERIEIIRNAFALEYQNIWGWEPATIDHPFGPDDRDKVENFSQKISEMRETCTEALRVLTDEELEKVRRFKRESMDLSRFRAAPSARLSHLSFESDGAFPAQC